MAYYRPDVVDLIRMQGGAMYGRGRVYEGRAGSGLIGGGLIGGGISGGRLPPSVRAALYEANPSYAKQVEAAAARGPPPRMNEVQKAAAAETRRRNKEKAVSRTIDVIESNPLMSAQQVKQVYKQERKIASLEHKADKARSKGKVVSSEVLGRTRGQQAKYYARQKLNPQIPGAPLREGTVFYPRASAEALAEIQRMREEKKT